ncbi:MAG: PAS domain S-box protein [Methanomicrobiales archaeon]
MKIKTQVIVSLIIFAILSILIISTLFSANAQLQEIQKKQQIIDNIEKSSFDLSLLGNDYLVHGGTIPIKYWNAKNVELAGKIQELIVTDPSQKAKLKEISESRKELNTSFFNLVGVTNNEPGMELPGKSQEIKEFYESTLAGQTQRLISRSAELLEQVKAETLMVQQWTNLVILFSFAVLMVFVILNYLFINRSVLTSLSALRNGSERIGSGDLDTKIEIKSNDELGVLANAFNNMAARLRELIGRLEAKVAELQNTQAALQESEEKYHHLIENSHDIIYTLNTEGILTFVSPSWTTHLGHTVTEVVGKSFQQFVHPDDNARCMESLQIMIKTGQRQTGVEYHILHADGSWRWHTTNAVPLRNKDGMIVGGEGSASDITDRKQADEMLLKNAEELHAAYEELTASQEELRANLAELNRQDLTLRESNEKIRLLLNSTAEAIYGLDMKGNCTFCNNSCLRLLGYKRQDELLGRNMHWQIHAKYPDGTHFPVEECRIFQAFNKGEGTHVDDEVLWRSDDTSFPAEYWSYPQRRDDVVVGAVVTFLDITERKRVEEALQRVNQKLNVLSQLTRKDLVSQTFVLSSYLELTKNQLAGQDQIIELLQKGIQEVRLINKTIEYSKDYQDMGVKPPKWQNVKMALLHGLSHISISEIKHSLKTGDLEIFADPLLEKVCQHLFENSVKHGDYVTMIRVWHTITPEGATIFFEDDGTGISQEIKEQIFLRGEGTSASRGGLIFVREILDITGITIEETGEPGKGARFEITVPNGVWRMAGKSE